MGYKIQSVISMMPDALLDEEKTLFALIQSRSKECKKPLVSLFEKEALKNEQFYQQLLEQKRILQEEIKQLNIDTKQMRKEVYEMDNLEKILKNDIATLKKSLPKTKKQSPDEEELSKLREKVCSLKDGIEKKKNALKSEMGKFTKGVLFYKKYLHCVVMLDSKDTVVFTFDTSAKSVSDLREYLRFSTDGTSFQFLEMRPKLKSEQQLVRTYNETGDIQGFIVCFWNITKRMNSRKVLCEKNSS